MDGFAGAIGVSDSDGKCSPVCSVCVPLAHLPVSHDAAALKAAGEYARFAGQRAQLPAPVEAHFEEAIGQVKQLEKAHPARPKAKAREEK